VPPEAVCLHNGIAVGLHARVGFVLKIEPSDILQIIERHVD
jgi:hypothetical protein